jgi:hypothetical protein
VLVTADSMVCGAQIVASRCGTGELRTCALYQLIESESVRYIRRTRGAALTNSNHRQVFSGLCGKLEGKHEAGDFSTARFLVILTKSWLPTLDNLRNFFLTTTTEVLSFSQQLREAP